MFKSKIGIKRYEIQALFQNLKRRTYDAVLFTLFITDKKKGGKIQNYEYLKIIKPAMNLILCIFLNRVKLLKTRQTFCHI